MDLLAVNFQGQRKLLCSNHFDICTKWTPAESCSTANVCRWSCSRTPRAAGVVVVAARLAGRPTASKAGRKIVLLNAPIALAAACTPVRRGNAGVAALLLAFSPLLTRCFSVPPLGLEP